MATAAEVVEILKDIESNSPGISKVTVDGLRVERESGALEKWERREAREASPSRRPISATISLRGG